MKDFLPTNRYKSNMHRTAQFDAGVGRLRQCRAIIPAGHKFAVVEVVIRQSCIKMQDGYRRDVYYITEDERKYHGSEYYPGRAKEPFITTQRRDFIGLLLVVINNVQPYIQVVSFSFSSLSSPATSARVKLHNVYS